MGNFSGGHGSTYAAVQFNPNSSAQFTKLRIGPAALEQSEVTVAQDCQGRHHAGEWTYVADPVQHVQETNGLTQEKRTSPLSPEEIKRKDHELGKKRATEIKSAMPSGKLSWCEYTREEVGPGRKKAS